MAFCIFLTSDALLLVWDVLPLKCKQKWPLNPLPLTELPACGIPLIAAANVRSPTVTHTGRGAHDQTPLRVLRFASVSAWDAVSTSA